MQNRKIATAQPTTSVRLFAWDLVAGILIVDLVVAGLAGLYLYRSRQQVEARVAIQTQNLSQSLSLTLAGVLDKTSTALFSVKGEAERQLKNGSLDFKALNRYILEQKDRISELDGLRVANSAGYLVCGDRVVPEARVPFADREVFVVSRQDPNVLLLRSRPARRHNTARQGPRRGSPVSRSQQCRKQEGLPRMAGDAPGG